MDARLPDRLDIAFHDGVLGRMRSRSRGEPCDGVPELVLVHGMTACDYLLPGLRELSAWTRVHLIDLPGCGGSGDPPHELGVAEFAGAVVDWLAGRDLGRVVLVGHSSGTQVAAEVARRSGNVAGVVLASPVFDPAYRSLPLVLWRWALDLSREPPSLEKSKPPRPQTSRRTATAAHLRVHRRHRLDDAVAALPVPVLVIRGRRDALSTRRWAHRLAEEAAVGRCDEVPGPHTFCWGHPAACSPPIRAFSTRIANASDTAG